MYNYINIKQFICGNPNSKFKGILNEDIILGKKNIGICFYPDSENCYWPINSSLFELLNDGWIQING